MSGESLWICVNAKGCHVKLDCASFCPPLAISLLSTVRGVQVVVVLHAAECFLITCFWKTAGNATNLSLGLKGKQMCQKMSSINLPAEVEEWAGGAEAASCHKCYKSRLRSSRRGIEGTHHDIEWF